jgi:hypothetical protein
MKKYYLNEEEITKEEFNEQLEGCITEYVDNNYDDLLDEDNEEYRIGYLTFSASEVLKNCDPVAYRCGFSDYESEVLEEAENELENSGYYEIDGDTFKIEEDEEEE